MMFDFDVFVDLLMLSLVFDVDVFECNFVWMNCFFEECGVWVWFYIKMYKCVEIVCWQVVQLCMVGLCCVCIVEVEVFVVGGIEDVFIILLLIIVEKIECFVVFVVCLQGIWIVVDSMFGVDCFVEVVCMWGVCCGVVIDFDLGFYCMGVFMGDVVIVLGCCVFEWLEFELYGVQMYVGMLMYFEVFDEWCSGSVDLWKQVVEIVDGLCVVGVICLVVIGGGMGIFDIDVDQELIMDLQVGLYVFMDVQYCVIYNEVSDGSSVLFDFFELLFFVFVLVVSQSVLYLLMVDVGFKVLLMDYVFEVVGYLNLCYYFVGDEYGIVVFDKDDLVVVLRFGECMVLFVSYCDLMVNFYEEYVVFCGGEFVECWFVVVCGCV